MIEAILWDNDGVLVDSEHLYFEATRRVLSSAGVSLSQQQYVELFLTEGRGAWHLLQERGASVVEVAALRDERNALYSRLLVEGPHLVSGIAGVLETLHDRFVMCVVTSSRKDHFDLIHRSTGLLKYFDFVLTSDDYERTKPHPDPYLMAVERVGVHAEACVAVEDSERGLASAIGAGIRCIVVPTPLTRGCRFVGAHRVLASVGEIPTVLSAEASSAA